MENRGAPTGAIHHAFEPEAGELGATLLPGGGCSFLVWAPQAAQLDLKIIAPREQLIPMQPQGHGYFRAEAKENEPGTRYFYTMDGKADLPDPASRHQPEGVHGPSEVVANSFPWTDAHWRGIPLQDYIIYELHTGTFTPEGTFEAVIPKLPELQRLGITAIELMPVAQFPGARNWGYDGVGLYAAQNTYGGPLGMKKLVNACHEAGIAVILDVVYNHLGPEGNYLSQFGPYFTHSYQTPWGWALNFDGPDSEEVRRFFIGNALYWQRELHIDALRLDAVHSIRDNSAVPFLQALARRTHREADRMNRSFHLIAETDLNAPRFVLPEILGGYGLDAQWSDDFHHCLHVLLTGEQGGYYRDFAGVAQFGKVFEEGYAYTGEYSHHRKARHGTSPKLLEPRQFVVCAQNHDQIGNRAQGERLTALVDFERLKLAAGAVMFSPYIPLLFMGEEHAEPNPFLYVTSHGDKQLIEAVRKGRREEFASFAWSGEVPDSHEEETFTRSIITHALREQGKHKRMFDFYAELIRLRKELSTFREIRREEVRARAFPAEQVLAVEYHGSENPALLLLLAFGETPAQVRFPLPAGPWERVIDSATETWEGPGSTLPVRIEAAAPELLEIKGPSIALYRKV